MITIITLTFGFLFHFTPAIAQENAACPDGTYSITSTADGGTISILFDSFIVKAGGNTGLSRSQKICNLLIPMSLPAGFSVGVYKVDYRGFAQLGKRQFSDLFVDYSLGSRNNGRNFHRRLRGPYSGDFGFSETLGAGAMKRLGCGGEASLDVMLVLNLQANGQPDEALAALDSVDGAPKGGLIYHFDYKKCGPR